MPISHIAQPNEYRYTFRYPGHFIIIGTSGAATHPKRHHTYQEAEKEAERLAYKHPGEEFLIYEVKTGKKQELYPIHTTHYA